MKAKVSLLALIAILLLGAESRAQTEEAVRRVDIENLIEYGFEAKDVLTWLAEKGRRLEIDAADLAALEKRSVDASILAWLRARLPETTTNKLDVGGVISLWQAEKDERKLLATVKAADRDWLLAPADVLALTRAEVPRAIVEWMRGRNAGKETKPTAGEKLVLDDIMKMTADGMSAADTVARIKASPSRYEVDAQRILELKRDGLPLEVLQAIYERRIEQEIPPVLPVAGSEPTSAETTPATAVPTEASYGLIRNLRIGFMMLQPSGWVTIEQYNSTKSLVQIVDPGGTDAKGMPDLELSVMSVHPKKRTETEPSAAQLEAIAMSFIETLSGQFARDGIEMDNQRPRRTWVAARPALLIESQARVTATNASYRSSFYILHAKERIWVLGYSCRLEKCAAWLPVLENCLRSFSFGDDMPPILAESEDRGEQVAGLFEAWRHSVRRFDFDRYRSLHDGLDDGIDARRGFLALATSIDDEGKRLEIDGVDFDRSLIHYNVFGLDGRTRSDLGFLKVGSGYRLVRRGR